MIIKMRQIIGSQPVPMWVAIGENLVSNQQIIGIIKHANGKSTPDAMGRLGKTAPPCNGNHLGKFYLW
jgi:hypothetical protein